jgi:hypothetical protein
VTALGIWLFFRGSSRGTSRGSSRGSSGDEEPRVAPWLAAGLLAGFSFGLREANALLFAPLFIGAVVRREKGWTFLVVGGALGLAVRGVAAWLFFDDPFHMKPPNAFSLTAIGQAAPLYLLCLLVLVPGGLISVAGYRGSRRPEIVTTVVLFVLVHLAYGYSGEESGWTKRLVLGPRFFIPLLPFLALTAAEVWPRWARQLWERRSPPKRATAARAASMVVVAALAATAVAIVGVQWAHAEWTRDQATIRDAIYANTHDGSVIVSNSRATGKFMDHLYGQRLVLNREKVAAVHLSQLLVRQGRFYLVFLDRTDSAYWRENAMGNARFLSSLARPIRDRAEPVLDLQVTPTDHLRIWRVGEGHGELPPNE